MATTTAEVGHWETFPLVFRELEVRRVERLTPRYTRITLGGEQLAGFASLGPADHLKLLLPPPGAARPTLPARVDDAWVYPQDQPRSPARDFTPRRYDPAAGELDLEFVLHGDGPAAAWAAQATPGHTIGIAGPRGSYVVDAVWPEYLLAGDETAIAAISRWLEIIPAGARVTAFIEVNDAQDELPLAHYADLTLTWLHRNGAAPGATSLLRDAIAATPFPIAETYVWAGGEATGLKAIRRHLLNERGLPKDALDISGHWKYRVTNWDHHEPIDEDS